VSVPVDRVSLLVSSFDAYAACWQPFCYGLQKYWADCPYPLYFIANTLTAPCGETIKVGQDRGWSANLRFALDTVQSPFILYAQEDYWLNQPVNTAAIAGYVRLMEQGAADYIRLYPYPRADAVFEPDSRLGVIGSTAQYRASLQMALWRTDALRDLLRDGEHGWAFEVEASIRSRSYGARFLTVNRFEDGASYIFTAVVDGEWSPLARDYARSEGIHVEFDALPKKPILKRVRRKIRSHLYHHFKRYSRSHRRFRSTSE